MADDESRNVISTRQQATTVQDLRDNRLADGSKKCYRGGLRHIVAWLRVAGRTGSINPDGSINLDVFTYEDFTEFVLHNVTALVVASVSSLVLLCLSINTIGTHSLRKVAATYAIAGSTSGPSIFNVCIRCGWSIGSVVERYVHYDGAGDQYVGRVGAGLPLGSGDFAVLPPHFIVGSDDAVSASGQLVFPRLWRHEELRGVLKSCLASLIYHKTFLENAFHRITPCCPVFFFLGTH
ncbi:hypothetical protein H257_13615 [Aphanomyces astaci]|uniref:Uncharacterized protein n=1 Tax=Aphanomyces astaci TaxID=112090 RepID=W4FTI4_APHAT|nr:hypothetical protein H257_13615 [Aphanomyces astaci]ETV70825.1 hypothetical protein H257_13615 [Aphanomyces astaci]|eukprot:XP_009839488.1 hypothetical protein H257_13615 [Aphanomyces astaci]